MNTPKTTTQQVDLLHLSALCHQLSNPKKLAIIQYIQLAKISTAAVIQRKLSYKQPTVSKYLQALTKCQLLTKEKIGSCVLYYINQKTWNQFNNKLTELVM